MILFVLGMMASAYAGGILALDAGTVASPVQQDFTSLHPEGCEDTRVKWLVPPHRSHVTLWPDDLAGDGLTGGSLSLTLSKGTWSLWVMLGGEGRIQESFWLDSGAAGLKINGEPHVVYARPQTDEEFFRSENYSVNPFPIFRQDETEWDRQVAKTHRFKELTVEVSDDPIVLEWWGRPLQAIVAAPVEGKAELDLLLSTTQIHRRDTYHNLYLTTAVSSSEVEFLDESGPMVVEIAPPLEMPLVDHASPSPRWSLSMARGDRVTRVFWVFPGDRGGDIHIQGLDDFYVETHEVHWLDTAGHRGRARRPRPSFMRPVKDRLRGGQGMPAGLAVTLTSSEDAPSGKTTGTIRISKDSTFIDVEVEVSVVPISLVPSPFPVGFIAPIHPAASARHGVGSPLSRRVFEQDARLMTSLGMSAVGLRYTHWPSGYPSEKGNSQREWMEELGTIWASYGGEVISFQDPKEPLRNRVFRRGGAPKPLSKDLLHTMKEVFQVANRSDLRVLFALYDEEGGFKHLDHLAEVPSLVSAMRGIDDNVEWVAAMGHPADFGVAHLFDVVLFTPSPTLTADHLSGFARRGVEPWTYNLSLGRSAPLLSWALGAKGHLQWNWYDGFGDPFNHVHQRPVHYYGLLGPNGDTWPTLQLEAFTEGVMDLRYLETLAQCVSSNRQGKKLTRSQKRVARTLLATVKSALNRAIPNQSMDGEVLSPYALSTIREEVGTLLRQCHEVAQ